MADTLNIGVSALAAFQRALDTISHNVANVNTPGYSRQTVNLATPPANQYGTNSVGNGVQISGIRRLYDQAIAAQVHSATAGFKQLEVLANYADRVNRLFSDSTTGLAASMQQFTNALETLSTSPSSATARQVVISQAQNLATRFRSYQGSLDTMSAQLNAQVDTEARSISEIAASIADLNRQIMAGPANTLSGPNDLLDKRDLLLGQLSEHLAVTTVMQNNGAMNVYIGSGQSLVVGGVASKLQAVPGEFDRGEPGLTLSGYSTPADVTGAVTGGTLGGLLQLRNELLQPAKNELGQVAATVASLANQQQAAGLDLQGNRGSDLFTIGAAIGYGSSHNAGSAALTVTRSDLGAITAADYQLRLIGGNWVAVRSDTGAAATVTGAGTTLSPLSFDGLQVVVSGTPAAGDAFLVRSTGTAVAGLGVALTTPEKIAAAGPLLTAAGNANTGSASISAGSLVPGGSWTRGNYTLQFTAGNAWQVLDSGNAVVASGAYVPGAAITFNGMSVAVSGAAAAGDTFTIRDNAAGKGDGRNARALIDLLNGGTLNGGSLSVADAAGRLIGKVGVQASQAASGRDAQNVVLEDATSSLQSISGVNLDEEAADLVRYQQAYQAAARIIATAKDMFDTLLAATGR